MEIKVSKKDLMWSYIGTFMSIASNILLLPFLVYYLDADMLGLWYVFSSIGAIGNLFDFGFSVTFARNITYCWSGAKELKKENVTISDKSEPDYALMKNVLETCRYIYLIISCIALLLLLTVGTVYVKHISKGLDMTICLLAWGLYALSVFLGLYYGYFASFLRGVGAIDIANKNTVFARVAQIVLTIVFLFCGLGLVGACAGYLIYGTLFRVLGKSSFYKYKDIGKHLKEVTQKTSYSQIKELFFVIWHNAWRDGAISLCNYFCNQASTLICSAYLTLAETGMYSLAVQIVTAVSTVAAVAYNTYQPSIQSNYISGKKEKVKSTMAFIVTTYSVMFLFFMVIVIVAGIPVLRIIKPDVVLSVPIMIGLGLYQFILKFRNCYTSYFSSTNRIPYLSGFATSAILCVVLSFLFIGILPFGIWGLILAQLISQLVYNAWYWPLLANKELEIKFSEYWRLFCYELNNRLNKKV